MLANIVGKIITAGSVFNGERIVGPDGMPYTVTGSHDASHPALGNMVRITFSDGSEVTIPVSHRIRVI